MGYLMRVYLHSYILYLVPSDWSEADGGCLDLFKCDEHCNPVEIVQNIVPKRNTLLMFEVSEISYHQVIIIY